MKVLSLANFKGGIMKTSSTRALGDLLGQKYKVLMVDLDPQASLTLSCKLLGVSPNMADVFSKAKRTSIENIIRSITNSLYLAPSSLDLAVTELELISRMGREKILDQALSNMRQKFDLVICDCPPSLSMLTLNALTASDAVLIPTKAEPLDISALRLFLESIEEVREELNPSLEIMGVLPVFFEERLTAHRMGIEAMEQAGWKVLPYRIGKTVKAAEAPEAGQSIITYEPGNKVVQQYKDLAEGIERWLVA